MMTNRAKKPGQFKQVVFGDVHLGHPQTPTVDTIYGLNKVINDELLMTIDRLIIEGDLFDRLLHSAEEATWKIQQWATQLMFRCAKYDVQLRVLKGTPSHDWDQSQFFEEQRVNANIPVDMLYISNLFIEYDERFDIHTLYVPDRCRPHTDDIYRDVKIMMKNMGLSQVDFAVMHGAFRYQLPAIVPEPTHDEQSYLDLVRYYIMIGHVHQQSQYDRILAAGSFDRGGHGDEGAKGAYQIMVRDDGTSEVVFLENKYARKYVTLDVAELSIREVNVMVRDLTATLPKRSAIRIRCNPMDAAANINQFKIEYPHYTWDVTHEKVKKSKETVTKALDDIDLSQFKIINEQSLLELLLPELQLLCKDDTQLQRCMSHLEDFI